MSALKLVAMATLGWVGLAHFGLSIAAGPPPGLAEDEQNYAVALPNVFSAFDNETDIPRETIDQYSRILENIDRGDYKAALQIAIPLAKQGIAPAQASLGYMYANGLGVNIDYDTAALWLSKSAAQGDVDAQLSLGNLFYLGLGVPKDHARAASLYISALRGSFSVVAGYNIGLMYEKGDGVEQNFEYAQFYFTRAAAYGGGVGYQDAAAHLAAVNAKLELSQQLKGSSASDGTSDPSRIEVALQSEGGTFIVPVLVNGLISLNFTVDSGAADVAIPADVFSTLVRMGTIENADMLETRTYTLADGSTVASQTFRIRSLKVGDTVLEGVTGSVSDAKGALLLGQSFLRNFKSWSIDNSRNTLVLVRK